MPPLSVRGTLTAADLLPAAQYATWHRSFAAKFLLGLGCVLIILGVINLLIGLPQNVIPPIVLGTLFSGYILAGPKLAIRKQFKTSAPLSQEGVYEFDATQFSITRPALQVSMPWTAIHSVVEMPGVFAIFTTKNCFLAVPKRFFSGDELPEFHRLLKHSLAESRKQLISRMPKA